MARVRTAVAVVAVLLGAAGSGPAVAAPDIDGTKQFEQDCTLTLHVDQPAGEEAWFSVRDEGTECQGYYLRSTSVTGTGGRNVTTAAHFDDAREVDLEWLYQPVDGSFLFGNVNVFVPAKERCHRYQLTAAGEVRFLDSRPCTGDPHPPNIKLFRRDCALWFERTSVRSGDVFLASEMGDGCAEYVLRGISVVSDDGTHTSRGLSDGDGDPSPHLESLSIQAASYPRQFVYGTVNVYVPYRSRCHRYRFTDVPGAYPEVRLVASAPCGSATR